MGKINMGILEFCNRGTPYLKAPSRLRGSWFENKRQLDVWYRERLKHLQAVGQEENATVILSAQNKRPL